MSLVRCGGSLSSGSLGDLAVVGGRCLGGASFALWVSGPFSLSCSAAPAELQPFFHPWAGSDRCGVRPVGQGGYRACSSFARFLQPSLCDSQGHQWVAPGDRPLAPEQLCGCLPFSYGDRPNCSSIPSGRGLVGIPGSPGCLPSGSGSSIFSPVPQVLRGRVGLPVPHALFWPFYGSSGLYHVSAIMHRHGFRILRYLNDWLVLASTFQESVWARDFLLWLCQRLGIRVNLPKSSLTPLQTQDYLGITIQTIPLRVFPTLKRIQKLSLLLQDFLSTRCPFGDSCWGSCPQCLLWFPAPAFV